MPLVSIGVPVYNGERFVRQALDSLLEQSYGNLEVIISDNASTDRTSAICKDYAARDPRIRYHRIDVNMGLSANFRRVFELSSGEYFMWACADDLRPPSAVEDCLKALLRNNRAVMAHGAVLVKRDCREDLVAVANEMDLSDPDGAERVRVFTKGIGHNAMLYGLYRRRSLARGRFKDWTGQDYLFCLQMCLLGPLEYDPHPMIIYRQKKLIAGNDPMYEDVPITLMSLLKKYGGAGRRKCWKVLVIGCCCCATIQGMSFTDRVRAIAAHISTFSVLHRTQLIKEVVFQLFLPAAWISLRSWQLARRWSFSLRLVRKLQAILEV